MWNRYLENPGKKLTHIWVQTFTRPGLFERRTSNAIHQINHYPVDSVACFVNSYPLDSNLFGG